MIAGTRTIMERRSMVRPGLPGTAESACCAADPGAMIRALSDQRAEIIMTRLSATRRTVSAWHAHYDDNAMIL